MNRETPDQGVKEFAGTPSCTHAEELVTYLYGEATEDEARAFGKHLSACASCREEVSTFGQVRRAIGDWRAQALALTPSLAFDNEVATREASATGTRAVRGVRSALASLRDFFVLSPSWLQAGSSAAALLLCALAVSSIINAEIRWDKDGIAFNMGGRPRVLTQTIEVPVARGPSPEEVEAIVAERVARELNTAKDRIRDPLIATASRKEASPRRGAVPASETEAGRGKRRGNAVAARTEQLATRAERDEDELPGLYDLLSEVN